jgi:quercetin dioxygenase-like cupin family protein
MGNTFEGGRGGHIEENFGETMSDGVLVELKKERGTPLDAPSHDAVEIDTDHHTVEFENELVRVVRMRYPEGYETPPHNHYPGVNIHLADFRAASGPEGEDVEPIEGKAGSTSWADNGKPHVTRNLGGELHLVRVEIKVQ